MNTQMIATLVATFALGGAIGGGAVYHFTNTVQVSCPSQAARSDTSRFFTTTPIPRTGKTYP